MAGLELRAILLDSLAIERANLILMQLILDEYFLIPPGFPLDGQVQGVLWKHRLDNAANVIRTRRRLRLAIEPRDGLLLAAGLQHAKRLLVTIALMLVVAARQVAIHDATNACRF